MKRRDESGAVALMVALLATVLMGVSALTVDLGAAFAAKHDVQSLTDRAVLAGGQGADLPAPPTTGVCPYGGSASAGDQAVKDVAAYLGSELSDNSVTPAQLVDCDTTNGELFYGTITRTTTNPTGVQLLPNRNQLALISPQHKVDFGFAKVLGYDHMNVDGAATVEVRSPQIASVPFYAYTGCDYGQQTIAQPNNGHASSGVLLASPDDTNGATLASLSLPAIPLLSPTPSLTILGIFPGLVTSNVTDVGFFESGTSGSGPAPVTVSASAFTLNTLAAISLAVPAAVSSVADVWYVRVKIGGKWSAVSDNHGNLLALPLTVGQPPLTCGQGSDQGNFGTLQLPNSLVTGQWQQIAMNIAQGPQHTLGLFPDATFPWTCSSNLLVSILTGDGTNCVGTKPGMDANAAQAGFIDGIGSVPGRLSNVQPGTGCGAGGAPATTVFGGRTINDDTLSCFLTDPTTNIGQINSPTYTLGKPVLSATIYKSPRFFMVPVLGVQPSGGGSTQYQLVSFRPAFLTDQVNSATRSTPATAANGITGSGSITSVQVVFINPDALPTMEGGSTTTYAGTGPKSLQLVN